MAWKYIISDIGFIVSFAVSLMIALFSKEYTAAAYWLAAAWTFKKVSQNGNS